jgi:acyl carrier protein
MAEMDSLEIRVKVKQIIATVTNVGPETIGDSESFTQELGFDSLSLLEIGVDVDYEFQLGLPEDAMRELDSVDATVALVNQRLAELGRADVEAVA